MRHVFLSLFFSFFSSLCIAQNLVPNGSFELYDTCPSQALEFGVESWSRYRESADYFNTCANGELSHPCNLWGGCFSVPCNLFGCQESSTGNGYAGIFAFYTPDEYREIIGTTLSEPLTVGQTYYVSFKASPGWGRYFGVRWFSNKLGVKFSMNEYNLSNPPPIDNFAHVYSNDIISDTLIWTTISGSFVADAAYEYVMLGNFFNNENTDTLTNGIANYATYYYIDDVCVTTNPAGCNFTSSIKEAVSSNVMVYPNPATNTLYISYPDIPNPDISIFNTMGQSITVNATYGNGLFAIDTSRLPSGTFFLKIKSKSTTISKKIFINY